MFLFLPRQFEAMSLLHQHHYDLSAALSCLVPSTGPMLCRDQMEEWAASEANLFEEALDKYGKDFNDIRQDFVSTERSLKFFLLIFDDSPCISALLMT